jgi:MoaA/NifB/PqqE/SkfB family radical SAM enzyme
MLLLLNNFVQLNNKKESVLTYLEEKKMLSTTERKESFGKIIFNPYEDRFILEADMPKDLIKFYKNELSAPLTVHWLVTMKCNARCKYCYERNFLLSNSKQEDLLSKDEITSFLKDFSSSGGFRVYLTGGEPTLNPNLEFIIRTAYSNGIKMVVNSNGLSFSDNVYQAIKDCQARLSLSLDSHVKEIHNKSRNQDSYDSLVRLIDKAAADSVDIRVISVFQNQDYNHWLEFGKFLQDKHVNIWFIQPLTGSEVPQGLEKMLKKDLKEINIRVLPAIFDSFFYLMPNGEVVPYAFQKKNVYGNVRKESIKEIWKRVPKKTIGDYLGLLHINFGGKVK